MTAPIPDFQLLGETAPFPDLAHCEPFAVRAPGYDWRIAPHRHRSMAQLFVVTEGRIDARIEDRAVTLRGGDLLFLPSGPVHAFDFRPGTEGHVLSLPVATLGAVAAVDDLGQALSGTIHGPAPATLGALVAALSDALQDGGAFRTARVLGLVQTVLASVAATGRPAAVADPRLAAFDALIARHRSDGWPVADYAAALGLTPGHLSRLCRAATGRGASAYLASALMTEACRLLAFTALPVSEVGYRLGFPDPSHFAKRFRAIRGEAPSAYRARLSA